MVTNKVIAAAITVTVIVTIIAGATATTGADFSLE
jgi:hypothetical protein